ncbi:hypothetical protein HCN44_003856 [Aphidius gifuensis]|uniref:Ionotropic receptor n=1 Tax=Aphidius gifuensis TaxID=684658 RepID=A0A835CSW4_APHGI|nr:hypothetical protein HCN44_003856 [Aphidius gifuensis]
MFNKYNLIIAIIIYSVTKLTSGKPNYHSKIAVINQQDQAELTADLLNNCFNKINTIIILSEKKKPILNNFKLNFSPSFIMIENINKLERIKRPKKIIYMQPPRIFLIQSKLNSLNNLLNNLKSYKIFWDIKIPIIILNENGNCNEAENYLFILWKMDFLNCLYICIDLNNNKKLLTFNPYIQKAPEPWKINKIINGSNDHPWTLFEQDYSSKKNNKHDICKSLNFDKARDLGNYPTRVGAIEYTPYLKINKLNGSIKYSGIDADINLQSLLKINTSIESIFFDKSIPLGYVEQSSGNVVGIIGNVSTGDIDLLMNSLVIAKIPNTTTTFTYIPVGLTSVTKKLNPLGVNFIYQSPSLNIYLSFIIIGLLIFTAVNLISKQSNYHNFIIVIQIIFGYSLNDLPVKFSMRIVLCTLMIFFLIINLIIPGNLKSSLTVVDGYKNIEDIKDLNELGYRVKTARFITELFDLSDVNNLNIREDNIQCQNELLSDNDACLDFDIYLKATMNLSNNIYHMPKKSFLSAQRTYLYRRDWPGLDRINKLQLRMMDCGLVTHWFKKYKINNRNNNYYKTMWEPLNILNFKFSFYVLFGGLAFSIIICLLEVVVFQIYCNVI